MSRTSTFFSSLILLHQVFVCKTHVIPLRNFGDALRTKMSKPKIRPEMFDDWEDVEGIIKACLTLLKSSELSWLVTLVSRKLENLLPGNTMKTCSSSRYLLIVGRAPVTIRSSSSSTSFRRCYATSRCRYRLMHPGFPTRSSATETQSSPPSSGFLIPLPNSTAVTTYASSMRTLIKNLMTAWRKNLQRWLVT